MITYFTKTLTCIKRTFLFTAFSIALITNSNAQEIKWQNTIGGSGGDNLYSIQQTTDGGYILSGYSDSEISGDKTDSSNGSYDYWIIKTDTSGNIQWQNSIGGSGEDYLYTIKQTADGGYILGGVSNSNISGDKTENSYGDMDYWIVKTDSLGNIQWENTIGGNSSDYLKSIQQTTDKGYILGGYSNSSISGDKTENCLGSVDYWILKTDSSGNIQWQNTIGGSSGDALSSIQQTADGGYILGGSSQSYISGDKTENSFGGEDYWIVKTDSSGNIQWQNNIGGNKNDALYSVQQTPDGGYILGGTSLSDLWGDKTENCQGIMDYWIVKTDALGNIQWQNTIGGNDEDWLYSIQQTADGGYICGGKSNSPISGDKVEDNYGYQDCWIVKTDSLGEIQWQNTIIGDGTDVLFDIKQTADEGFILAGTSTSNMSGDKTENSLGYTDYWIIKLTSEYNLITGNAFIDVNSNGVHNTGEPVVNHKQVTEINTGRLNFSGQNGDYGVSVLDTGNFTVLPSPVNYYNAVPVSHNAFFNGIQQTDSLNDFAFQAAGVFNDLCLTFTALGPFRPGFNASYIINYENAGTTTINGTVKLFPDNVLSYLSSSLTPVYSNADSVEWNVGTIAPFQTGSILVTFHLNISAVIGSSVYTHCIIEPIINDANPNCNYSSFASIVKASFDPNDILVSEDTLTTSQLAIAPYLDYIIRFQNTGNDTAFTVKVINPIDTNKLQLSSLEFVSSSHPVQLNWVNYNRNMEFLFANILLPDSNVNEPLSHGFVHYRIKPKAVLSAGDNITNNAYIYFDFNAPVETNTAVTHIVTSTSIFNPQSSMSNIEVFPNPAKDEITITGYSLNKSTTIKIVDVMGKEVYNNVAATQKSEVNTQDFSNGVYFVQIQTQDFIETKKLIIQK